LASTFASLSNGIVDSYQTFPVTVPIQSVYPSISDKFHVSKTSSEENRSILSESLEHSISGKFPLSWRESESENELSGSTTIGKNDSAFILNNQVIVVSGEISVWISCIVILFVTGTFFLGWSTSLEYLFFDLKEEETAPY
jgi:hypothetical protein